MPRRMNNNLQEILILLDSMEISAEVLEHLIKTLYGRKETINS